MGEDGDQGGFRFSLISHWVDAVGNDEMGFLPLKELRRKPAQHGQTFIMRTGLLQHQKQMTVLHRKRFPDDQPVGFGGELPVNAVWLISRMVVSEIVLFGKTASVLLDLSRKVQSGNTQSLELDEI